MTLDPKKYVTDPADGLPCEIVGAWAQEKYERVTKYIDISRWARRKFLNGQAKQATFIDLYSGPGRCQIKGQAGFVDGGCVAGWKKAEHGGHPFTKILISDAEAKLSGAAESRLTAIGATVVPSVGNAEDNVGGVVEAINPYGLHFAYLDPFNLTSLPFSIIQTLARLKHVDMLIHVSVMDLQRNAMNYSADDVQHLDRFAPGWRNIVPVVPNAETFRTNYLRYWKSLVSDLEMEVNEGMELVRGTRGERLYWLAFIARDKTAHKFWNEIRDVKGQGRLL